jgi:thiamine-phosphate pyrophosphorylase
VLDPFYPIVESADWIARLLPCGVRLAQLRIKDRPDAIRSEIATAKVLCDKAGAQLVVNDYWAEAVDLGCSFVHLGQDDLATADLAALRRAGVRLGVSTHDEAELACALEAAPNYIALGPIYPTILKQMAFAPQGLARIGEWKRKIGAIPLVAIGGISLERAKGVFEAGADIVAVVTDITLAADPEARTRDWVRATRNSAAGAPIRTCESAQTYGRPARKTAP